MLAAFLSRTFGGPGICNCSKNFTNAIVFCNFDYGFTKHVNTLDGPNY